MSDCVNHISIPVNPLISLLRGMRLPVSGILADVAAAECLGVRHLMAVASTETTRRPHRQCQSTWVLVGTLSGRARVRCRDWQAEVGPGFVYVIPPHHPFEETNLGADAWHYIAWLAHVEAASPLLDAFPTSPFGFAADYPFFERFLTLLRRLNRGEPGDALAALGLLVELVADCRRHMSAPRSAHPTGEEPPCLARALALMRQRLTSPLPLSELARHCCMSPSSLVHHFKAATGLTPGQWVARERMAMARRLLLQGRTVSETADELGFANPFHFSRVFHRIEGVPPSRFQRLSRDR